jgi:hypothetical protein
MINIGKLVNLVVKKLDYVYIIYLNHIVKNVVEVKYANIIDEKVIVKNVLVKIYVNIIE